MIACDELFGNNLAIACTEEWLVAPLRCAYCLDRAYSKWLASISILLVITMMGWFCSGVIAWWAFGFCLGTGVAFAVNLTNS